MFPLIDVEGVEPRIAPTCLRPQRQFYGRFPANSILKWLAYKHENMRGPTHPVCQCET